jgi:hypothetical protein
MLEKREISSKQPSSPQIQRRSFLKMVGAGLLASIPVAAGLLKPRLAHAANCTTFTCVQGNYYHCTNHNLFLCVNGTLCYDYFTGQPCFAYGGSCGAIACC